MDIYISKISKFKYWWFISKSRNKKSVLIFLEKKTPRGRYWVEERAPSEIGGYPPLVMVDWTVKFRFCGRPWGCRWTTKRSHPHRDRANLSGQPWHKGRPGAEKGGRYEHPPPYRSLMPLEPHLNLFTDKNQRKLKYSKHVLTQIFLKWTPVKFFFVRPWERPHFIFRTLRPHANNVTTLGRKQ